MTILQLIIFSSGIFVGFAFGIVAALAVTPEPSARDDQHECVKGDI